MKNLKMFVTFAACLLVISLAGVAVGQDADNVYGNVYDDETNNPIGGVNIEAENMDTHNTIHVMTTGTGYYSTYLPPGNYHVTASASGYLDWEDDFTVEAGETYPGEIRLTPESGGGGGTGGGDTSDGDTDGDSPSFEDIMPFDEEMLQTMLIYLLVLIALFFACLITITITLIVMFVRLGKVRKELTALNETQKPKPMPQPTPPAQPPYQPAYQQPPPPPTQ